MSLDLNTQSNVAAVATGTLAPRLGSLSVAYLAELSKHGIFEGPIGEARLSPAVAQLVAAVHQVLAGGEVRVEVVRPGFGAVADKLDVSLRTSIDESNRMSSIHEALGVTGV